ncbi:MAG: hypothetical protein ABSB99_03035 [Acidimicrobiales bacterium]
MTGETMSANPGTNMPSEEELALRFGRTRIGELCTKFIRTGFKFDAGMALNGRQYLVAYISAQSPFSDIPRAVETNVFAESFQLTRAQILNDYGKYDAATTFVAVIDTSTEIPHAVGALRIIEYAPNLGFKDVNDLVEDDPANPWINEIKAHYFGPDEPYDPNLAWVRLSQRSGVDLRLEESLDIATHASVGDYRGKRGAINSVSMLFYHACLRYALATSKKNLLAIFDLKPLYNLQQFGEPFHTYPDLEPHAYGGPYDTIPAYCVIDEAIDEAWSRFRNHNPEVFSVFVNGASLDEIALLPNEYFPETFSNEAVSLGVKDE